MTSVTDICNKALQQIGTRTTVTDAQIAGNLSNEAIQFNIAYTNARDDLLRMAPWDCAIKVANLQYITSVPTTPENSSPPTPLWQPGQPAPPWAYEYQYPVDCLRACWVIPSTQTGYAGGVPITTATTGGSPSTWLGGPIRFKIQNDQFYPALTASIVNGGTGYVVGEIITLAIGPNTSPPIGGPAQILVTAVSAGVITAASLISQINGANPVVGGSYFLPLSATQSQGTSNRLGVGATFNLTFGNSQISQRVILTNQELATLAYVQQVTDPNVFDSLFQSALISVCASSLALPLTGDKKIANSMVELANRDITEARAIDGDEGLTINDVTPDWISIRGINYTDGYVSGPYGGGFDWGSTWPAFI